VCWWDDSAGRWPWLCLWCFTGAKLRLPFTVGGAQSVFQSRVHKYLPLYMPVLTAPYWTLRGHNF